MVSTNAYSLRAIGFVRSRLTKREDAPEQSSAGAPEAWVQVDPAFADALDAIAAGDEVILLTWLHHGDRDTLPVHILRTSAISSRRSSLRRPSARAA